MEYLTGNILPEKTDGDGFGYSPHGFGLGDGESDGLLFISGAVKERGYQIRQGHRKSMESIYPCGCPV